MKRYSEKLIAATLFVSALAGTMALLPLALDTPAYALDASPRGPDDGTRRPFSLPSERIEARLAYIRTALKIDGAQAQQWDAVADVMRRQAKEHDAAFAAIHDRQGNTPGIIERLEFHQRMAEQHAADLAALVAAAKPLYAALTPEQKQIADSMLRMGRDSEEHGGWGHHGDWNGRKPQEPDASQPH